MQKAIDEKKANGDPMEHGKTRDLIGKEHGDSGAQVQRYLRLNYLSEPLQKKVDNGTISMRAGVELSYLTEAEQDVLRTAVLKEQIAPTIKQAKKIRVLSEQKRCTLQIIREVLRTKDADLESAAKQPEAEIVLPTLREESEDIAAEEIVTEPQDPEYVNSEISEPAEETEAPEEDSDGDVPEDHKPSVLKAPERTVRLNWSALSPFFPDDMSDTEIERAIIDLLRKYGERRRNEKPKLKVL